MSLEEKEPYIQIALDYKNKNNLTQNAEKPKLNNKKRKRSDAKNDKDNTEDKKEVPSCQSEIKSVTIREKKKKKKVTGNVVKDNCNEYMNEYFNSVFVPFVESSYEFFKDKSIIKPK